METLGHKADQPGLRGHSHDPEQDLMKRFVVRQVLSTGGFLALASFNTKLEGVRWTHPQPLDRNYDIVDQFNDDVVVWRDHFVAPTITEES